MELHRLHSRLSSNCMLTLVHPNQQVLSCHKAWRCCHKLGSENTCKWGPEGRFSFINVPSSYQVGSTQVSLICASFYFILFKKYLFFLILPLFQSLIQIIYSHCIVLGYVIYVWSWLYWWYFSPYSFLVYCRPWKVSEAAMGGALRMLSPIPLAELLEC